MKKLFLLLLLSAALICHADDFTDLFDSENDYNYFISEVNEVFENDNTEITISEGVVSIISSDIYPEDVQMGLWNLAGSLINLAKNKWKNLIQYHFNTLKEMMEKQEKITESLEDFDSVKELLFPRIYHEEYIPEEAKADMLYYDFNPWFDVYIILDTPTAVRPISLDEFKKWNISREDLLEFAIDNLFRNTKFLFNNVELSETEDIFFASAPNEVLSTSYILNIEDRFKGKYGTFVGIPNRNGVIIYPVNNNNAYNFLDQIIRVMVAMYNDGPGSISYNLFWLYENEIYTIELIDENNFYKYKLPKNFDFF